MNYKKQTLKFVIIPFLRLKFGIAPKTYNNSYFQHYFNEYR